VTIELGYQLSSEEHPAPDLVGYARRAEEVGFSYAVISDHFHPWTHRQGQAPFVWAVLGAIAQVTKRLRLGTAVTAPIRRTPPHVVAQAAATVATLLPGRFFLGVGTGENLNEHITGEWWPPTEVRREMLEEAIDVIRELWTGSNVEHFGRHYTVDNARIYSRPSEPPPILVAADGVPGAQFAGRIGDGLIAVSPSADLVEAFTEGGGTGKPRYAQLSVCVAEDESEARRLARTMGGAVGHSASAPHEAPCPRRLRGGRRARLESAGLRARRLRRRPACAPGQDQRVRRRRLRSRARPPDRGRPGDVLPLLRTRGAASDAKLRR
jgi:coenzyme F420-dependent glucose-6-phosphate dehydrogenase